MRQIKVYLIAALLASLVGVSADLIFNYDYYEAKARYAAYRRAHPKGSSRSVTTEYAQDLSVEDKQPCRP